MAVVRKHCQESETHYNVASIIICRKFFVDICRTPRESYPEDGEVDLDPIANASFRRREGPMRIIVLRQIFLKHYDK